MFRPTPWWRMVDVAPTLLDIAGLEPPAAMNGRSRLQLLFDNRWHHRAPSNVRHELLPRSFEALALSTNLGPPQTANY